MNHDIKKSMIWMRFGYLWCEIQQFRPDAVSNLENILTSVLFVCVRKVLYCSPPEYVADPHIF